MEHLIENRHVLLGLCVHFQLVLAVAELSDFRVDCPHFCTEKFLKHFQCILRLNLLFFHEGRVESLHRGKETPRWRTERQLHQLGEQALRDVVDNCDIARPELLIQYPGQDGLVIRQKSLQRIRLVELAHDFDQNLSIGVVGFVFRQVDKTDRIYLLLVTLAHELVLEQDQVVFYVYHLQGIVVKPLRLILMSSTRSGVGEETLLAQNVVLDASFCVALEHVHDLRDLDEFRDGPTSQVLLVSTTATAVLVGAVLAQ